MPLLTAWGNSTGCRLPVAVLDVVGWRAGDRVQILARPDGVVEIHAKQVSGRVIQRTPVDAHESDEEPTKW
jgi:antitoxin component of MazEF toxin-antitoxin module